MKRITLVLSLWIPVACGGSSSETPFPQAPVEPALQARHDAVLAESTAEDSPATEAEPVTAVKPASEGAVAAPATGSSTSSTSAVATGVSLSPAPAGK